MYNNPYMNNYNQQATVDRINAQMNELEKMKQQLQQPIQQPTNLTQNFQLTPNVNPLNIAVLLNVSYVFWFRHKQ